MFDIYGEYKSIHSEDGKKNAWFDCHRKFLYMDNTYRRSRYGFRKNIIKNKETPVRLTGH